MIILNVIDEAFRLKDYGVISSDFSKNDLIFFDILESISPQPDERVRNAALVLMAKYFESCDIFEDPQTQLDN